MSGSARGSPAVPSASPATTRPRRSGASADALLDTLPAITLVVGKGGVGKTTTASALAVRAAERSGDVLLLSTDPARALPSVLGADVAGDATPVPGARGLSARALDTGALRSRFLARWGDILRVIIDRGTYLDASDIAPLVDTALPGGDEIFGALALAELVAEGTTRGRLFVDTAPTGHTLRLLALPDTFRALVRLLDAMQAKHRFMVRTLTRAYRGDEADAFLAEMTRLVSALEEALRDPRRCAALVVTTAQPVVIEETRRYVESLRSLGVHVAAAVWNGTDECRPDAVPVPSQFMVERLDPFPVGMAGLQRWLHAVHPVTEPRRRPKRRRTRALAADPAPQQLASLLRPLTIVAGKGGVGKTSVACALALASDVPTLVVSTDPAPSLADVWGQPVPDADTPVTGAAHVTARQMDATAAFDRLRTQYASRVDALFDAFIAQGVDMSLDRAIARDLLALAPPGVDEVYALTLLADALRDEGHRRVIVDPAPTGHLLRLLEMPQLALAWTHQLMRLLLKYKDVAGLGETARDLLDFARDLRALDTLMRDERRCGLVLVTLDEPVVQAESERLARAVREHGVAVAGVIRNRVISGPRSPLPAPQAPVHFEAPEVDPSPVGAAALRAWTSRWRPDR